MPANDKGGKDRLVSTRRGSEEIDDRDLLLHGVSEPSVVRGVRVGAHESVFDNFVTVVDLAVRLALIVIPNPPTTTREDGSDREQPCHLLRLEDAPLRVHKRN